MPTTIKTDADLTALRHKLAVHQRRFIDLREKVEHLEWELDLTSVNRDRALYWLLCLCEAAEREHWPLSDEASKAKEHALDLLCEHNIFAGLPEPDAAILHLMEIVAVDLEDGNVEEATVSTL